MRNDRLGKLSHVFNILIGHMSLVGPRPDFSEFFENLNEQHHLFLGVKLGITGHDFCKIRSKVKIPVGPEDPEKYYQEVI